MRILDLLDTSFRPLTGAAPWHRTPAKERLVVFSRWPEPGTTKTRMIPALGAQGAADLQRDMTEHAVGCARRVPALRPVEIELRVAGGDSQRVGQWLGPDLLYADQGTGGLGQRMDLAVRSALASSCERVALVGSDIPGIDEQLLARAFQELERVDLVLGPATDGGYWLIAMRRHHPELFADVRFGTHTVLAETQAIAKRLGLQTALLPSLSDVDRPEDLPHWLNKQRPPEPHDKPDISVVIPARNEEAVIAHTVGMLRHHAGVEVIVADGGSHDETCHLAARFGATVVEVAGGRAAQQNQGAQLARANRLLFLHADTVPPHNWPTLVTNTLACQGVAAGAFSFATPASRLPLRIIEHTTNFRSHRMHLPYGDQGLFMTRATFDAVGGFPRQLIMEDYELVQRLRRVGRVVTLPQAALTSARRFQRLGVLRTSLVNQAMLLGYALHIPPAVLARWYRSQ